MEEGLKELIKKLLEEAFWNGANTAYKWTKDGVVNIEGFKKDQEEYIDEVLKEL